MKTANTKFVSKKFICKKIVSPNFSGKKSEFAQNPEFVITESMVEGFRQYLMEDEKAPTTIDKYICDIKKLMQYADGQKITKELMIRYKEKLYKEDDYKVRSVNSFLVAANRFFEYMEWYGVRVRTYRVQNETFCEEERCITKEEYKRLLKACKKKKNMRLYMILETIAATGMRVSEIQYVTAAAVKRGVVEIHNKGKIRSVLLPTKLKKHLLIYIYKRQIARGPIFCTRSGKAVNRSNVWGEMKKISRAAGVDPDKVFPHNLRHLFAQCFYHMKKDLAKLADLLGHSSIETTRIYIRESSKEYLKQLDQMDLVEPYY